MSFRFSGRDVTQALSQWHISTGLLWAAFTFYSISSCEHSNLPIFGFPSMSVVTLKGFAKNTDLCLFFSHCFFLSDCLSWSYWSSCRPSHSVFGARFHLLQRLWNSFLISAIKSYAWSCRFPSFVHLFLSEGWSTLFINYSGENQNFPFHVFIQGILKDSI